MMGLKRQLSAAAGGFESRAIKNLARKETKDYLQSESWSHL